jgi:hypothetical protein
MYIIVDDRNIVAGGYATGFHREGVSSAGIEAAEFREWIAKISDADMHAVEAFLIGDYAIERGHRPRLGALQALQAARPERRRVASRRSILA